MSVGENIKHDSSTTHVSGKSVFIDDRPRLKNEVLVGVVGAPVACGKIKKINVDSALRIEGVLGIYTGKDFHHNKWGAIVSEQPILADDLIGYIDEPILIIAALNEIAITQAKKLITFDIEELKPIFTIDEAIKANRYITQSTPFIQGDAESAFKNAPLKLEGVFECGGQEHFYLESQATIAYPLEQGSMEIHSSSQHPTETQHVVAHALGIEFSKVTCIVKRMGGGFGGKESQAAHFAAMAALVAQKLNRPARLCLNKDDDMMMTGKRHPFKNFYQVGFDQSGKIKSLIVKLYANGGAYTDLTPSILDRAMFHIDGCYFLENCRIEGYAVRTNQHSNTAFRGFGGPQGNITIESIIEDMSKVLKIDALEIRERNLYGIKERNKTPYNQILENNTLPEIFEKLKISSDYLNRRNACFEFNKNNRFKLRGLSLTGCKFGIAFTAKHLNQGNALVNLHLDGTVQVSTGGTEMGQGLNTKIRQIVADTISIPVENVQVMATSTEKNHNTSPTAASSGADINGAAAKKAAEVIVERLKWVFYHLSRKIEFNTQKDIPQFTAGQYDLSSISLKNGIFKDSYNQETKKLIEVINIAYFNRISLGEYSFFKTENLGFDKSTLQGRAFNYYTNGAAVSEVEIDKFTGELKVIRTDILMDLGRSINPGIDLGQVSGAFIQGMGWVTTENLYYNSSGKLLSHSPTTYKIPNIQDTPREFKIDLIENNSNVQNVLRSKAVGEPPFLLGTSVWTAVKDAISYHRSDLVKLNSPATHEAIFMELHRE